MTDDIEAIKQLKARYTDDATIYSTDAGGATISGADRFLEFLTYGHYHETYEKRDDRWRIKSSRLTRLRTDFTPTPAP